ncbi:hypothetical protein [Natronococcus sp. A-GB7]|uniref:hypothetical protein n=1 Tax=Natronococcus sp. A-GB7 TaxID=3037649 RepID=UPI00241C5606|nr:hypothetical protein [Natronococcus sp. A-GB7]MDG5820240.1 hypothetical protein [Natronococcus sp. A-GB7]
MQRPTRLRLCRVDRAVLESFDRAITTPPLGAASQVAVLGVGQQGLHGELLKPGLFATGTHVW